MNFYLIFENYLSDFNNIKTRLLLENLLQYWNQTLQSAIFKFFFFTCCGSTMIFWGMNDFVYSCIIQNNYTQTNKQTNTNWKHPNNFLNMRKIKFSCLNFFSCSSFIYCLFSETHACHLVCSPYWKFYSILLEANAVGTFIS